MPQFAVAEIAKQVCVVCNERYSSQRPSGMLPCLHHFCAPCIEGALDMLRKEAAVKAKSCSIPKANEGTPQQIPGVVTIETIVFGQNDLKSSLSSESASTAASANVVFPSAAKPSMELRCPLCHFVHEASQW